LIHANHSVHSGVFAGRGEKMRQVLPKTALSDWINTLLQDYRVIAPVSVQEFYKFREINTPEEVVLEYPTSILPPKKVVLPPREDLLQFDLINHVIEPVQNSTPTVVIGIHTCDLHAMQTMDHIFESGFPDQHYARQRENTTLVSVECLKPCSEYSFCKDMDTQNVPDQFDLHMTDLGDAYILETGSEKGEQLLKDFEKLEMVTETLQKRYKRAQSQKWSSFTYRLRPRAEEITSLLALNYRSILWQELGDRCLSCGACNLVCPTCFCFDVRDEADLTFNTGKRYRVWDSCQINPFASVAGGHNFRPNRAERLRHRFFHKFKYLPDSIHLEGCVGCGRCADACLVGINPIDVLNKLYQRQALPAGENKRR
jgi:sulfhydrogenase subunit beta (sulfur reductase)